VLASVIVPTLGDRHRLLATLRALSQQTVAAGRFEVLVVVDRPDPAAAAWVRGLGLDFPMTVLTSDANRGPAHARNRGLAAAAGEVAVFIDDDCLCAPGFLAEHLWHHQAAGGPVVLGLIRHIPAETAAAALAAGLEPSGAATPVTALDEHVREDAYANLSARIFSREELQRVAWAGFTCGNSSVRRDAVLRAGGFDEGFSGWGPEDVELGLRLYRAGARFVFEPRAIDFHLDHLKNFGEMARSSAKNLKHLAHKYPGDEEVHLYLKFVGHAMSLEEFAWRAGGCAGPPPAEPGYFFRPFGYLAAKSR